MPNTPHSSRGPSRSSIGSGSEGVKEPGRTPAGSEGRAQPSNGSGLVRDGQTAQGARSLARWFARIPSLPRTREGVVMAVESPVTLDRQRIQELIRREDEQLNSRTPG